MHRIKSDPLSQLVSQKAAKNANKFARVPCSHSVRVCCCGQTQSHKAPLLLLLLLLFRVSTQVRMKIGHHIKVRMCSNSLSHRHHLNECVRVHFMQVRRLTHNFCFPPMKSIFPPCRRWWREERRGEKKKRKTRQKWWVSEKNYENQQSGQESEWVRECLRF